jgi:Na+/H+ antiporter NhaD/arsenite permease-like protein
LRSAWWTRRRGIRIDWKRHARTGVPVTVATLAISWLYRWYRIALPAA